MKDRKPILIFDWDGVIVDSNEWKWGGAWGEVFKHEPELIPIIKEVLSGDPQKRLSRGQLIDGLFICARERGIIPQKTKERYIKDFGALVREGVVRIGLFPHAEEVLRTLHDGGYRMYVISATAQKDLEYSAEKLGVDGYFLGLYGRPGEKIEHAREIQVEEESVLYIVIGDGEGDRELAEKINAQFIGIANRWNGWEVNGEKAVSLITEVLQLLESQ